MKALTRLVSWISPLRRRAEEGVGREAANTPRPSARNSNVSLRRRASDLLTAYANRARLEREGGARLPGANGGARPRGWSDAGLGRLSPT